MRLHKYATDGYDAVGAFTGVTGADRTRLILMLFDGLLDSLAGARGHIEHGNLAAKGRALGRASQIVLGLRGALDFEQGGELARNLDELYGYVTRRLLQAHAGDDVAAIDEVRGLMAEIRGAWATLPGLGGAPAAAVAH